MGLHHIINGERVECTPEEEVEIKSNWAKNKKKIKERNEANKKGFIFKEKKWNDLKLKLSLTDDEVEVLREGK